MPLTDRCEENHSEVFLLFRYISLPFSSHSIRMKALEFKSKISKKGLVLSDQVKKTLASWEEKEVKVILLLEEDEDQEKELKTYAVKKFLDGYDDRDMVYDSL